MNIDRIIDTVCKYRNIPVEKVLSRSRQQSLSETRQIICFFAFEFKCGSFREIGEKVGNRNHANVIYSIKQVSDLMCVNHNFRREIQYLRKLLSNPPDHDFARKMIDQYNHEMGDNISFDQMSLFSEFLINKIYSYEKTI